MGRFLYFNTEKEAKKQCRIHSWEWFVGSVEKRFNWSKFKFMWGYNLGDYSSCG